jgi:hypothetical protein
MIATLDKQIRDAGIPIDGVSKLAAGGYKVWYQATATAQQISAGDALAAAFDDSADNNTISQRRAIIDAIIAKLQGGTNLTIAEVSKILLFILKGL